MTISELITSLETIQDTYGDLDVLVQPDCVEEAVFDAYTVKSEYNGVNGLKVTPSVVSADAVVIFLGR